MLFVNNFFCVLVKMLACSCLIFFLTGCSQQEKDKGIKEMIATRAKKEVAFAGVNYNVANGVVTLSGNCPTEKERSEVENAVKQTSGVKDVIDQITVAPVVLNGEHLLKQAVDSVLMKYPSVQGVVQDSIILLQGQVDGKTAQKIMTALQGLHANGITNQLLVASK